MVSIAELGRPRAGGSPVLRPWPMEIEPSPITDPFLPFEVLVLLARTIRAEHHPQDFSTFRATAKAWKRAADRMIGAEGLVIPCLEGIADIQSTWTPFGGSQDPALLD